MSRTGDQGKGQFVLIAYPAEYRSSGVMTFSVTERDLVYEKDLGPNTSALASSMATFHQDSTWRVAEQEGFHRARDVITPVSKATAIVMPLMTAPTRRVSDWCWFLTRVAAFGIEVTMLVAIVTRE
jgi:hypothetical protein